LQLEEFLAHGVIIMQTIAAGRTMERTIQVEKMRETQIDRQPRPYRITEKGIEVYPKESVI
jgi:KaiC/GvpD/RAD55 family RecA-like ATPase